MKTSPKVSIVIATYNAASTIREAIDSILMQSYPHIEIIIIDGNSNDGTQSILQSYGEKIGYWKSEADGGIYDAMNKGIKVATGDWILFLGADDTLCTDSISQVFNSLPSPDNYLLIYGCIKLKNSGKIAGKKTSFDTIIENNIPHQAILYQRCVWELFGNYNLQYKILADYDLNMRIFESRQAQTFFLPYPISVFNTRGVSNRTIDVAFFTDKMNYLINKKNVDKKDKRLTKYYFFTGVAHILQKKYRKGFVSLLFTVFYGNRKMYYLMLIGDFFLSLLSIRKKYRCC